jgi:hypothetical protein
LKRLPLNDAAERIEAHPRRACLGLIEARTPPGRIALLPKHPRRARSALLKHVEVDASAEAFVGIRGVRVSASLKHRVALLADERHRCDHHAGRRRARRRRRVTLSAPTIKSPPVTPAGFFLLRAGSTSSTITAYLPASRNLHGVAMGVAMAGFSIPEYGITICFCYINHL